MSSSKKVLDGKRNGNKAPEKSNFASTCNLLSQYLKETGKLKELSRSISGNLEPLGKSDASQIKKPALPTKKLLNKLEDLNQPPIEETTPMEELVPLGQIVHPKYSEDCPNKASTSKQASTIEAKSSQMTILYDGKIWVFDDLPANKAYELMILAKKGNTGAPINASLSTCAEKQNNIVPAGAALASNLRTNGKEKVEVQLDNDDDGDDNSDELPIARRSSLHRFLEKRKERSSCRGPYQVGGDSPEPSSNEDKDLELRL